MTRLDPLDEAAYRAAVTPLVEWIERSLGPEVLATRAVDGPDGWTLAPWRPARATWRSTLAAAIAAAPRGTTFVVTDVRDCYGSIVPRTIASVLGPASSAVVSLLHRLGEEGVRGLPVGPAPSAILANAVLGPLDAAFRAAGVRHVRWVDDVVVWGRRADVLRAVHAFRVAAGSVGLQLHDEKTFAVNAPEDARSILGSRAPSMPVGGRTPDIIAAP